MHNSRRGKKISNLGSNFSYNHIIYMFLYFISLEIPVILNLKPLLTDLSYSNVAIECIPLW